MIHSAHLQDSFKVRHYPTEVLDPQSSGDVWQPA